MLTRGIRAAALLATLAMTLPSAAPVLAQRASEDALYKGIANAYLANLLGDNPSQATQDGVHTYDDQLDDLSEDHFSSRQTKDTDAFNQLQDLDVPALSPEVRIDRQMLVWSIQDDQLQNGEMAAWRHNPDLYTQTASSAVYGLISQEFAPLAARLQSVIARENAIPALLATGRKNTTTVDAATAQVSADDTDGAIGFFRTDVPLAFASITDAKAMAAFKAANDGAIKTLEDYAAWIKAGPQAHPEGTFAIGREAYRRRLLYEDGLTTSVEDYLNIGETALYQTQAQFRATARQIDPRRSPQDVYASLALKHPPADGVIAAAQGDITGLRAFVESHRIITLPPDANITAVETPSFQRSQIFAAFTGPGPLEKVATKSYYYVTLPSPTASPQEQDHLLGFLNDYGRPLVTTHEVMPGHFVNAMIDRHLNLSLTRKLLGSSVFAEGWAHYCEQMIVDQGWGGGDPHVRLAQLGLALLREGRFIVGFKEHTQHMSLDDATQFLVDNVYMSREAASKEALRGTQDPMYGYYTLGKLMILKLRNDYAKKMGRAYTLQGFHDALLAHGDPQITLLRPLLLGNADDGKPL
jgi:uncharacterized protein DUF885